MSGNDERARAFKERIIGISKAYGMSVETSDSDDSFRIVDYDEWAIARLRAAPVYVKGYQHAPAPHVPLLAGGPDEEINL